MSLHQVSDKHPRLNSKLVICIGIFRSYKIDSDEFVSFAAQINKHAERFDIGIAQQIALRYCSSSFILEKLLTKMDRQCVGIEPNRRGSLNNTQIVKLR